MPKSITASPRVRVPKSVLRRFAELARVPAEQRTFFFESVLENVQTARELDGLAKGALATKNGEALQHTAVTLLEMLSKLNHDERKFIDGILRGKSMFIFGRIATGGIDGLLQTAQQLALLFTLATGKPHPLPSCQSAKPRKRGRRPGSMKHAIFQDFVFDLLISTRTAGGTLTLDKDVPSYGSLITAIKMLTPYLPDGFVPSRFSSSTLQRLKTRCGQIQAALVDQN